MVSSSETTETVESDLRLVLVLPRPMEIGCGPGIFYGFDGPCRSGKIANTRLPKFRISWKVSVTGRTSGGHTANSSQVSLHSAYSMQRFLRTMQPSTTYQTHHLLLIYRIRTYDITPIDKDRSGEKCGGLIHAEPNFCESGTSFERADHKLVDKSSKDKLGKLLWRLLRKQRGIRMEQYRPHVQTDESRPERALTGKSSPFL